MTLGTAERSKKIGALIELPWAGGTADPPVHGDLEDYRRDGAHEQRAGQRDTWQVLLERARFKRMQRNYGDALQLCDRVALSGPEGRYQAALLRGDILLEQGEHAAALSAYESVADPDVLDPQIDCARGLALFQLTRLPEAANALRSAVRGRPELAQAWYTLGLISEIRGDGQESELFRQARVLEPKRFPPLEQMGRSAFEQVIQEAMATLPVGVRTAVESLPVVVAEIPRLDDLESSSPPLPPTTLAMFAWFHRPGGYAAAEQPAIVLFKRSLERSYRCREDLVRELGTSVLAELGRAGQRS